MKTLLLATMVGLGLTVAVPEAQAGHRRYYSHSHCTSYRPSYSRVYYRSYVPRYYSYRPVRHYYRPYYSNSCGYYGGYYRRPGVSFYVRF